MRVGSLPMLYALIAAGFLFLGGCAPQPKMVAFKPMTSEISTEENATEKLADMSLETLLSKGSTYLAEGDLPLARLHLFKALTLAPDNIKVYQGLGELFLKMNQLKKAQTAYAEILKINPENEIALFGLGKAYRLEGDCVAAGNYLQQAEKLSPDNPDVLTEMAICYDKLEQSAQAEELYLRVAELQPVNPSSFNNLGFHYLIEGVYQPAIDAFLTGERFKPEDRRIRNNLAAAYILNGDEAQGLARFESSIGKAGAFNNVGYIYMVQNRWSKAEEAFVKALELNPSYYVKAAKNLDYLRRLSAYQNMRTAGPEGE